MEGYAEYATWRPHLAYLRDPYGDPDVEMELDGVGGVSILAKARVFRAGVHFPAFSFERHAETEGFGKMARRMQFTVVGLPHYTVWHLYEPSVDDIRHMEEMENEKREREQQEQQEKQNAETVKKIKEEFRQVDAQWSKDRQGIAVEEAKSKANDHPNAEIIRKESVRKINTYQGKSDKDTDKDMEMDLEMNTEKGTEEAKDEVVAEEQAESNSDEAARPPPPAVEPKAGRKKDYS